MSAGSINFTDHVKQLYQYHLFLTQLLLPILSISFFQVAKFWLNIWPLYRPTFSLSFYSNFCTYVQKHPLRMNRLIIKQLNCNWTSFIHFCAKFSENGQNKFVKNIAKESSWTSIQIGEIPVVFGVKYMLHSGPIYDVLNTEWVNQVCHISPAQVSWLLPTWGETSLSLSTKVFYFVESWV